MTGFLDNMGVVNIANISKAFDKLPQLSCTQMLYSKSVDI